MAETLSKLLAVRQTGKNTFTSECFPVRMGNMAPISYGGFQLGVALNAAARTANPKHYLYSATGFYLGPVSIGSKITCIVEDVRSTRTFSTRQVRVVQDGRTALLVTADFRVAEEALLTFNTSPFREYSSWADCKTGIDNMQDALKNGIISEKEAKIVDQFFNVGMKYWEVRGCPEGIFAQNFNGVAKHVKTTQQDLPLNERTTAEWYQIKGEISKNDQMAALGFLSDAAISFLPLSLNNMFLDDAGACSSLDFSLRVFANDIDLTRWHLVERRPLCGSIGVTHSVANIFDTNGKLVAQMSQQSIMRPKPVKTENGKL